MAIKQPRATSLFAVLTLAVCIIICLLIPSASALESAPSDTVEPQQVELICHTNNPDECYPKIFQATHEFQKIHDDQDIPSGLHVRLDIYNGIKEAKINVPDEINPVLDGLPVDHAMVVVDPEQADQPVIPRGAPQYEDVGKIKQPRHEDALVYEALGWLGEKPLSSSLALDEGLERLEDISHDIYYGVKITQDVEALRGLLCLMADSQLDSVNGTLPRDQQAASILSGALQNNPSALKEVSKNWESVARNTICPHDQRPLIESLWRSVVPLGIPDAKLDASKVKAKVSAINGLIKDDSIRQSFMEKNGMQELLQVLTYDDPQWVVPQRKVGQLALDNFLDGNMGAKLGQWPTFARLSDKECEGKGVPAKEGCWDYHVHQIMEVNKSDKEHWSTDLYSRLRSVRKDQESSRKHVEL